VEKKKKGVTAQITKEIILKEMAVKTEYIKPALLFFLPSSGTF
jgi:hypothetical protein